MFASHTSDLVVGIPMMRLRNRFHALEVKRPTRSSVCIGRSRLNRTRAGRTLCRQLATSLHSGIDLA